MDDFLTTLSRRIVLAPLDDTGRTQEVLDRLRTAILVGIFAEGERLPPEITLAKQLGVSPVTLRDAIRIIREEGLVTTVRGRSGGTFVSSADITTLTFLRDTFRKLNPIDLRDLIDLQLALTPHSARLAADRGTSRELQALSQTIESLEADEDALSFRRKTSRFLIGISAASRSARINTVTIKLQVELAPFYTLIFSSRSFHISAITHLEAIVDALTSRDAQEAFMRTYDFIESVGKDLQRLQFELSRETA